MASKNDPRKRKLEFPDHESLVSKSKPPPPKHSGGLNVEIHPLLLEMVSLPTITKKHNPLKRNARSIFDATSLNPYLNQDDVAKGTKHKPRPLLFNPKGKFIAKGDELRAKLEEERKEQAKIEEAMAKGLHPDENIGENLYRPQFPPLVEWWDRPYIRERLYGEFQKKPEFVLDNEEAPISIYIQHPVPIPAWEGQGETRAMYLTKKEMKRIRRNERQARHKEKQDRIRLGLDPPPPPKVKLSNLMNVLTNEAIKDPTSVEMRVRKEVEDRFQKHMKENEARKLTPEQKHEKIKHQHEKNLQEGCFTTVYKVDQLDSLHVFKVDINAKQLDLFGIVLFNPRFNLVVVEGGAKGIKFYKKLMTLRINWKESKPKADSDSPEATADLSNNKCSIIWEGQLRAPSFKKWSPMYTNNDDEAFEVLNKFGLENYWREACISEAAPSNLHPQV